MQFPVTILVLVILISKGAALDTEHNCSFKNEIIQNSLNFGYPKMGDIPLLNRKIIGGKRVSILEHPYVVSIRRQMVHYLTGTLVGSNLVLTVAHPIVDVPIIELGVVMGQNYNDRGSIIFTVILIIVHQDFDPYTLQADLAFLRVHEIIDYRPSVKTVKNIYNSNFHLVNVSVSAFVTGWGRCDHMGNELCLPRSSVYYKDEFIDPMLRSVSIQITENSVHCELYERHEIHIGQKVLCVGPARQIEHTCPCLAVPGAPLVVHGRLLGVLSWGFGCGYHTDLPLIYVDARAYEKWIVGNVVYFSFINHNNFDQLYETTKMAIINKWFSATRNTPTEHEHFLEIQPWKIDKELAMVSGILYDIRDYFGGKSHHEEKTNRYRMFRQSILDETRPSKLIQFGSESTDGRNYTLNFSDDESEYDNDYDYDALDGNPYAPTFRPTPLHNTTNIIDDDDYF